MWGNAVHRSLEPCMARDGSGGDHLPRAVPQVASVPLRTRLILKIFTKMAREFIVNILTLLKIISDISSISVILFI